MTVVDTRARVTHRAVGGRAEGEGEGDEGEEHHRNSDEEQRAAAVTVNLRGGTTGVA
jgi:hypothetical protein